MGASGWDYFVEYNEDVSVALEGLREEVFRSKQFEMPLPEEEMLKEYPGCLDSIPNLIEACAEEGTHSILDIDGVSDAPEFNKIAPFPPDALVKYFGTHRPPRDLIEAKKELIYPDLPALLELPWEGLYTVVYADDKPTGLFFIGFSGD